MSSSKVAVVGAGVVGLSAALCITEKLPGMLDVTLIADKFTPDTTSDKTGMILMPFDLTSQVGTASPSREEVEYQERMKRWTRETFTKFHSIYRSELNSEIQICLRSGYLAQCEMLPDPWWKECVFGFRHVNLESDEAHAANVPSNSVDLWAFTTYIVDFSNYLAWMMKQFQANGGHVLKKEVMSLDELSSYDIVVNCTGMRAGALVEEHDMQPSRGQVVLVRAPWISAFCITFSKDSISYILPRADTVVLGGTTQIGNWSEQPDPETAQKILENCFKLEPSLSRAKVIGGWAGLRPVRSRVRLDKSVGSSGGLVIHCYGHGGQGVVLGYGCAKEIGDMVKEQYTRKAHL